jgi:hypothetical protein
MHGVEMHKIGGTHGLCEPPSPAGLRGKQVDAN